MPSPSGGTISADFADLSGLAALFRRLRSALDAAVAAAVAASHDPLLAASAVADPVGAAHFEIDLVDVRDGPGGMRWTALELGGLADVLSLAVRSYRAADETQNWAMHHPGTVDELIGAITQVTGLSEPQIAGALALLYPDGRPQVRLVARRENGPPPRNVADLMAGLQRRCDISDRWSAASPGAVAGLPRGYDDGTIDIRRLSGPGGTAWIVDLPGTSDWDLLPLPWSAPPRAHDPADWGGDLRLMAGEHTTYVQGVADAMIEAGVRPGDPVLLTGHSQGGMVAMSLAGMLAAHGMPVRSVLTAGSPIAAMPRPPGTSVLSLENSGDLVPHLDGSANPAADNDWTTLRFTADEGGITADHGFAAYDRGAAAADSSNEPGVRRWLTRARPFLTATSSETSSYRIQRVP